MKWFKSLSDGKQIALISGIFVIIGALITGAFQLVKLQQSSTPTPIVTVQPTSTLGTAGMTPSPAATLTPTSVPTQTPTPISALGIDTLTDDFSSGSVPDSTKWYIDTDHSATVAVSGGQLLTIPAKDTISGAYIDSHMLYSTIGQSVFIQVLQVASGMVDTIFGLQNPDGTNEIYILYHSGALEVGTNTGGSLFTIPYNSTTQKWWSIRESGGTTYADVSPDGVTWTNIYSHANIFNMSNVRVSIGSYEWAAGPTPEVAKFANFNRN